MKQVLNTLGLFFLLSLPTAAQAQEYQQDVNFFELQVAQPVHIPTSFLRQSEG